MLCVNNDHSKWTSQRVVLTSGGVRHRDEGEVGPRVLYAGSAQTVITILSTYHTVHVLSITS